MGQGRKKSHYIVYDEKDNGIPVIVDGTVEECAAIMGVSISYFRSIVSRPVKRWTIVLSKELED